MITSSYQPQQQKQKKRRSTVVTGNALPGGGMVDIKKAASALPSRMQDGVLTESNIGGMKPVNKGPSNGLMEDLSVPNSLRARGKEFLNTGDDTLPKAPIGSIPPKPPQTTGPVSASGGGNAAGVSVGTNMGIGGAGVEANKAPPPAVSRAPRKSNDSRTKNKEGSYNIAMGKLAGPPTMSPEKFFSDERN